MLVPTAAAFSPFGRRFRAWPTSGPTSQTRLSVPHHVRRVVRGANASVERPLRPARSTRRPHPHHAWPRSSSSSSFRTLPISTASSMRDVSSLGSTSPTPTGHLPSRWMGWPLTAPASPHLRPAPAERDHPSRVDHPALHLDRRHGTTGVRRRRDPGVPLIWSADRPGQSLVLVSWEDPSRPLQRILPRTDWMATRQGAQRVQPHGEAWQHRDVSEKPTKPNRADAAGAQRLRDLAILRRVRDRIDREYAQPLDVEALARDAGMSAGHLSRQFRAAYGESPYAYLDDPPHRAGHGHAAARATRASPTSASRSAARRSARSAPASPSWSGCRRAPTGRTAANATGRPRRRASPGGSPDRSGIEKRPQTTAP